MSDALHLVEKNFQSVSGATAELAAVLRCGRDCLAEAGLEEAALDARLLLMEAASVTQADILTYPERVVTEPELSRYRDYLERRCNREPVAYILGTQDFMGLTFQVSDQVLIPNQDTETLVEEAMREMEDGMRFLDLCTGSGCIALSLLHYSNETTAVATDLSGTALAVAMQNAGNLGLADRIDFVETDLVPEKQERFDFIVSNPPYIPDAVIEGLEPEVAEHEPMMALSGGADGLVFYRRIAAEAPRFLKNAGWLLLEIGYDQGVAVSEILSDAGYSDVEVVKDYCGNDRVVKAYYIHQN